MNIKHILCYIIIILCFAYFTNGALYQNRCWKLTNGTVCINGTTGNNTFQGAYIDYSYILNAPASTSSNINGTDIRVNTANISNVCIGSVCIDDWSDVNLSAVNTYNETAELWNNLINSSFIFHYNTSWVKTNQNYWNSTDILGTKFCIGANCIDSWDDVNLTSTGNSTQEIWDNVINDSFIFHYNTTWITSNQNNLYNTSAQIFQNIANGSFLYNYNATWSKNFTHVNYSLICIGSKCIDSWDDVNQSSGGSFTNGTNIWVTNLNITLGLSLGNKTIYSFDQINLSSGDTSLFLKNDTTFRTDEIDSTSHTNGSIYWDENGTLNFVAGGS